VPPESSEYSIDVGLANNILFSLYAGWCATSEIVALERVVCSSFVTGRYGSIPYAAAVVESLLLDKVPAFRLPASR